VRPYCVGAASGSPRAQLEWTDLAGAHLEDAILLWANLEGANLQGATGITPERLQQETVSLEGATMPNGQKYEEWLKSKGRGEDGGERGP
jgi:uncharacterized protein YjbI with pentapeptide repeats